MQGPIWIIFAANVRSRWILSTNCFKLFGKLHRSQHWQTYTMVAMNALIFKNIWLKSWQDLNRIYFTAWCLCKSLFWRMSPQLRKSVKSIPCRINCSNFVSSWTTKLNICTQPRSCLTTVLFCLNYIIIYGSLRI